MPNTARQNSKIASKLMASFANALQRTMLSHTGEYGRYMFTVASGSHQVNYDQKCLNWFAGEMNWLWNLRFFLSWTLPCPCDWRLAFMDSRWRFDWRLYYRTNYEKICFYERIPWWFSSQVSKCIILCIVYYKTS